VAAPETELDGAPIVNTAEWFEDLLKLHVAVNVPPGCSTSDPVCVQPVITPVPGSILAGEIRRGTVVGVGATVGVGTGVFVGAAVGITVGGATTVGRATTVGSNVGASVGSGSEVDSISGSSVGMTRSAGDSSAGVGSMASCAATRDDIERKRERKTARTAGSTPTIDADGSLSVFM
jgi:hypothetical protein